MTKKEKTNATYTLLLLFAPLFALWSAWVLSTIYGWFLLSIPGAPKLTTVHFVGIELIIQLITTHLRNRDEKLTAEKRLEYVISNALLSPAVCLAFAWLYWRLFV